MSETTPTTAKSAIVVLRHGCDGGSQPTNQIIDFNSNSTVTFHGGGGTVTNNKVTVVKNWLGCLGLKQMHGLQDDLTTLLKPYAPVSRILSEGPGNGEKGTPNPISTISCYAKKTASTFTNRKLSIDLYDNNAYKDPSVFSVDALLKDGKGQFSTVICWEAKGMWRHGSDTGFESDSILATLGHCGPGGKKVSNYNLLSDHSPYKGQIIYIFECNDDGSLLLKVVDYDPSRSDAKFQEITDSSQWPEKLCTDSKQCDCDPTDLIQYRCS
ncbi:hypothetical protein ACFO3O_06030 [Dokdonia ponticola]|uniref:Uncharacterized protein n=1 Tax=Dokdonia ponticola TaxID=2041041 RepID=A0ABV9HWQ9_9FLAO